MTDSKYTFETGVIPAAGPGLRLFPYTEHTPKCLFKLGGKTLLERNIEVMRDKFRVKEVVILTGHLGEQIEQQYGDGASLGIKLRYHEVKNVSDGLAKGLLELKDEISGRFPVILGDELYLNANHEEFCNIADKDFVVACGVKITGDTTLIQKNYALEIKEDQITLLVEKPEYVENNFLGLGSYVFSPEIFNYIEKTSPSARTGKVELTDTINRIAKSGKTILPVFIKGDYRNINEPDDYNSATYLHRNAHFDEYKVSLIIPAYNEEASIAHVIEEFINHVDEVIVAENNSADKTAELVKEVGAKVISRRYAGYGDALRSGMAAAKGDIFILVEADASFSPDDLPKILAYMTDADMVIGTRTTEQMIQQGANMGSFLRWGNVLAAKVLELLFWHPHMPRFTDLGCTYRGIWREAYETILPNLSGDGPEFSPEMMVEILRANRKVIEIPVSYRPRIGGESKHSSSLLHILKTGMSMMKLIMIRRLTSLK